MRQSPTAAAGLLPRLSGRATGAALVRVHRVLVAQRHGQAPRPQRHVRRRLALLRPGARRSSQGERSHGPRPARGARRGLRSQGQGPSGPGRHGVGRGVGQELRQSLRNVVRHGELAVPGVRVHAAHLSAHQGAPQDPGRGRAVGRRAGQLLQPLVRGAHGAHPVRVGQLHGRGVGGEPAARQILLLHLPEPHQAARRRRPAQDTGRPAAERGRAAAGPAHPGARLPESREAALVQRGRRQPAQAVGGQHVVKRHVTIPDSLPSLPLQSWRRAAPRGAVRHHHHQVVTRVRRGKEARTEVGQQQRLVKERMKHVFVVGSHIYTCISLAQTLGYLAALLPDPASKAVLDKSRTTSSRCVRPGRLTRLTSPLLSTFLL
ncbi:hypothetical protein FOCC_FOCC017590 [Frankliniella occidentalis]|nr:hypothetical protein FOCC_FOCC017590 [Frankliniella occidentalis]